MADQHRLRVLESFKDIRSTTNPYVAQLAASLEARRDIELMKFSWPTALMGRYDVFHVHWPEIMFDGHKRTGQVLRRVLTTLLLLRLVLTRTPVVRTVHNLERPSDRGRLDHLLLDGFDYLTRVRIRLNDYTPMPADAPFVTIRHGHYCDWYAPHPTETVRPGRIVYAGLIRRYKGVEQLLGAFSKIADSTLSLHIAGKPSSPALTLAVQMAAEADARISHELRFLGDAEFVATVTGSELVVLPYHRMHNSGAALAALSLGRPVLVPDNDVNRALSEEVGRGWVFTFTGELAPQDLQRAIAQLRASDNRPPDLSARDWASVGERHERSFRLAVGWDDRA